ncbi:MAG: SDR family oxidoreductase [Candidatus Zixiibacteriota bacterium]
MRISGNTILITGGATGIGFALADAFLREGNEVVICGRRENKLLEAKRRLPQLIVKVCDVSDGDQRKSLFKSVTAEFETLNILVNNAGIQRQLDLKKGEADLRKGENEIRINFEAPVYLSALFIPHLIDRKESAIINVSSGLAFVPLAIVPIYCATKAAIHSFSLSLRHQLAGTGVKVFEVIPPTVDTELDRGAREERGQKDRGIQPQEVAKATLKGIANDEFEIAIGMAQNLRMASRTDPDKAFQQMNRH